MHIKNKFNYSCNSKTERKKEVVKERKCKCWIFINDECCVQYYKCKLKTLVKVEMETTTTSYKLQAMPV